MLAAVLETRGPDGVRLRDVPVPDRGPGEVLIRVHAAALNRVDLYMRDNGSGITHELPQTLGLDAAGTVVESDADALRPGRKVVVYSNAFCGRCRYCLAGDQPLCLRTSLMGEHRDGGFAEYVVAPERCVLPLGDDADLALAATLPSAYLTAWRMMFGKRAVEAGETVLVVGIGGGVAVACLQLARLAGAKVIVTSGSDAKLERAIGLGASAGINYRTESVWRRALELTDGAGVDMVVDSVGQASWDDSLRSLRRGGRVVCCGATSGGEPPAQLQRMFIRQLELYGSTSGSVEEFRRLIELFDTGGLVPLVDRRYRLDEVHAALDRLDAGEQFGKLVLDVIG